MRRTLTALVLAFLVASCGSSGTSDPATPTAAASGSRTSTSAAKITTTTATTTPATTTDPEGPPLEDAVRAYTAAFLGGDDEAAYGLLTERCHGEMASAQFKDIVDQATNLYGGETITSYSEDVNGNTATVTYELTDPTLNQTNERWVLENDAWRNDEC
jgi:hypothetical protein